MAYVTFNKNKTKNEIEALNNAIDGKLYFAADDESTNTDGIGIYLGMPNGRAKLKATVTEIAAGFENNQNKALSAASGSELNRIINGDSETSGLVRDVEQLQQEVSQIGTDISNKQDKVSAMGGATTPVYVSADGQFAACNPYPNAPGILNTSNSSELTPTTENLKDTINLHKISKTGKFSDLNGKPEIFSASTKSNENGTLVPPAAAGDSEKYLRGDGSWAEVSGGGGGGISSITINGSAKTSGINFYAPENNSSAIAGQWLQFAGANSSPVWVDPITVNDLTATATSIYVPRTPGSSGQILVSQGSSATNKSPQWSNFTLPSYDLPSSIGQSGEVMMVSNNSVVWGDATDILPSGATDGQYLQYANNGLQWASITAGSKAYEEIQFTQVTTIGSMYECYVNLAPNKFYKISGFDVNATRHLIYLDPDDLVNGVVNEYSFFFKLNGSYSNISFAVGEYGGATTIPVYMSSSIGNYTNSYYEVSVYVCTDNSGNIITPISSLYSGNPGVAGVIKEWEQVY